MFLVFFGVFAFRWFLIKVRSRVLIIMANFFNSVELAPPVEVFALVAAYNEDHHEKKVNLGIGGSCPGACV